MKRFLPIVLLAAAALSPRAQETKNILDIKSSITDSNIVFPESYELDVQKMQEGWYLKNYTASDDRHARQGDTNPSDATVRDRLASLNTVIELPYNQIVRSYIDRYLVRGRAQVPVLLGLGIYYMPIFEQALEEKGLPLELKYLPVIESGLNPNAVSKHGAAGLWQFMLATGRGLDMEISSLVDERRDPYVSSRKAAQYLKDLHDSYGDWSLAIAAYNCGPGTVNKALRRAGGDASSHDFWAIYNYLPEETRGYVPMFIAANYVMNFYPYHNISPVLATKPLVTDTLQITDRVHFNQISNVLDIPVEELRVLNPQFRADIIPGRPDRRYTLVLPSQQINAYIMSEEDILAYEAEKYAQRTEVEPGAVDPDAANLAMNSAQQEEPEAAAPFDPAPAAAPAAPAASTSKRKAPANGIHKVEPGETLSSIAAMYGLDTDKIKEWNGLTRNSLRTGQQLRVAAPAQAAQTQKTQPAAQASKPAGAPAQQKQQAKAKGKDKKKTEPAAPATHTVKSGENLSTIARKYGTTAAELQKANGMSSDQLRPGDELKLPKKATAKSGSKSGTKTGSKGNAKSSSKSGLNKKKRSRR